MRRFIIIFLSCAVFYIGLFYLFHVLTDVAVLKTSYPHVIFDSEEEEAKIEIRKNRPATWTNLGAISPIAVSAIVLSEDWAFYQHGGFDWNQMKDAFYRNLSEKRFVRGGSTISQQVA